MVQRLRVCLVVACVIMLFPLVSQAEGEDGKEIEEIKGQIEVLAEEIERLKLGEVAGPEYKSFSGLGPAASKVYGIEKGLSIGGYGEIVYENYADSSKKDRADTLRFILYGGYRFNDWIVMNTEIEFEHADETAVEFSYIDFLLNPSFNLRAGLMLVPFGITNEFHEPTVFNGVLRPDVERNIIPSTWRDIGIMAHGDIKGLSYKIALLNGMRSDTFRASDWIRKGRHSGSKANAGNLALVLNLEKEVLTGLKIGGSYYSGEAGEDKGATEAAAGEKEADIRLWEAHVDYRYRGLGLRALYVDGTLDGNGAFEASPPGGVGKEASGWYVEATYEVMPLLWPQRPEMSLVPFVRYESYNTQEEVFNGTSDPTLDRTVLTLGLGYKPIPNLVVKADYQFRDTASSLDSGMGTGLDENKIDQFNLGIGFIF